MRNGTFLMLMALAAAACGAGTTTNQDPQADSRRSATEAQPAAETASAMLALLPAQAAAWTRTGEPQRFGPGDLWEYINGAAEQYLSYGFQELVTAKYTLASGATASVDIYRMADRVNAFGMHAQEINPKWDAVPVGVEGRAGTDAVRFWSGAYYVKLSTTPPAKAEALALARTIGAGLGEPGGMPDELQLFPPRDLVAGSIRFVPADILGQSAFSNGFEAKYGAGPSPSTLVLVPFATADAATAAFTGYESFLGQTGRPPVRLTAPGDAGVAAQDGYYGRIVAARAGRWLVISLGARDERAAVAIVTGACSRLANATPTRKAGS